MANKKYFMDWIYKRWEADCVFCGGYVNDSYPHYETEDGEENVICWDCAYLHGYVTEKEYLKFGHFGFEATRAVIHNGEVYLADDYKLPWERTSKERRQSNEYKEWRSAVYERDNYTCQRCRKRGGKINAHHIKSFKDYPDLQTEVSNGVTLCEACHRKIHKEKDNEWIHT